MSRLTYLIYDGLSDGCEFTDRTQLAFLEAATLVIEVSNMQFSKSPSAREGHLLWTTLRLHSVISGGTLRVTNSGVEITDGQILAVRNVSFPIEDADVQLEALDPGHRESRRADNIFLGVCHTDWVYFRPHTAVSTV